MKLHKSWKHWCRKYGLRIHCSYRTTRYSRKEYGWFYLKGKGHVWRINCDDQLEMGDTYAEFDRWALCDVVSVDMNTITNEKQFKAAIDRLIVMKKESKESKESK